MTFPIGSGDGNMNIGRAVSRGVEEHIKRAVDPLNLFGGDSFGTKGASGLFPNGSGGVGPMEDILARMSGDKKENSFDTNGIGDLFSGGKGGTGGAGGGMGDMLGQIGGMLQGVVGGLLKAVMGIFGGGGGGMLGGL